MATITAQNIINKAEIVLQDKTNTRWTEDELLGWLNDGQREIVKHKPDANPTNESVTLGTGTKQTIPDNGMSLIEIRRNMGPTASPSPGRAVTHIPIQILNEQRPEWHTEDSVAEIKHYSFDERDPKTYYVYPPADGTSDIEIIYATAPSDIAIGVTLTIDDIYANSIMDYILYRAYQKDADYTANNQRVVAAYEAFLQGLGILERSEKQANPALQPIILQGTVQSGMQGQG